MPSPAVRCCVVHWLLFALAITLGCEAAVPAPERQTRGSESPATRPTETLHAEHDGMTLSVRQVTGEGWSGRLVVVAFASPHERHVRVVPSESPRPLDAILGATRPAQPYAAIDGGFYDVDSEPMGLVRTDGVDVRALSENGGSGVFLTEGGRPRIVHRSEYVASEQVREGLQSIDRLVHEGRSLVSPHASPRRAARSAVAIDGDGKLLLVVAFDDRSVVREEEARIELGSQSGQLGPTFGEMAELLVLAGARDALGLDGGISTALTVKSSVRSLRIDGFRGTINSIVVGAAQ